MRLCGYCGYAVNTSTTQVQPEGWDYQSPRALSALQDNTASLFTRFITGFARKLWRQILSNGGTKQLPHSWEVSQFVASGCFHQKRWWFVSGLQGAILPAPLQNLLFPEPRKLLARSASSSTTSLTTWGSLPVPGIEQDCMASHGWKDNASSQETWEFSLRSILAALDALGLLYLSCQPWFLQLLQKVHQVLPPDSLLLTVLHLQSPVSCFYFFFPPLQLLTSATKQSAFYWQGHDRVPALLHQLPAYTCNTACSDRFCVLSSLLSITWSRDALWERSYEKHFTFTSCSFLLLHFYLLCFF